MTETRLLRVELLVSPDCPNADGARRVVADALGELGLAVAVAEQVGDFASPTLLVDGVDVMTNEAGSPSVQACRLDVPTRPRVLAALRRRLRLDGEATVVTGVPDWYPPQLAVGVVRDRIRELSAPARVVHQAILRGFAATGRAPDLEELVGLGVAELLSELHERDVIRLDETGRVRAAYPFSGVPTAHVVKIEGGPSVYAMCAVDALGMAEMLGRDIVIASVDPGSGEAIRVSVQDGEVSCSPDTAVVFVGTDSPADGDCCAPVTRPAADRCCGLMNFFTSEDSAQAWIGQHPEVTGDVLSQAQAWRLGVDIFGPLLND